MITLPARSRSANIDSDARILESNFAFKTRNPRYILFRSIVQNLANITVPTLVIRGKQDRIIPNLEHPAQFNQAVLNFVQDPLIRAELEERLFGLGQRSFIGLTARLSQLTQPD